MTGNHHGLIVLDKPTGITSRAAVNRAQQWFPPRTRIGHTGTLDPLATGVLVLCIGNATRLAEYVQGMDKTYRTTLSLGARSDTDDADGKMALVEGARPPAEAVVQATLSQFIGEIEQTPPAYSAVKLGGRRAHDLSRRGHQVLIAPRRVTVYAIELLHYAWPDLNLEIRCGKGTYIRSLARDLGERLGCGAYVSRLRRTRVGPFRCEGALQLDATMSEAHDRLLPPAAAVADLPSCCLSVVQIEMLRNGQPVPVTNPASAPLHAVFDAQGNLVATATVRDGCVRAVKNIMRGAVQ